MSNLISLPGRPLWLGSPAVEPDLKVAVERTLSSCGQADSDPELRLGLLLDLIERLLGLAENRCAECGAPIDRLAGSWCSESCFEADPDTKSSRDEEE